MIGLLLVLALQQGQAPLTVEMQVDADRIPIGGEVVLTVRARSGSADPINITVPPFAGLELLERSERSEVAAGVEMSRTTVLEFRLRGSTAGKWRLGPARVRQGRNSAEADPVQVEVTGSPSNSSVAAPTLSPRVQHLLAQSRPRSGQDASVSILLSSTNPYAGEQVDVVTAAWFPRELRLQLRRPPTVQTPSIDGVYSYPQRAPTGIAASRQVDGHWFDLFVVHQIVFPLTPGKLQVPPATLHYSVPLAFQFFSQEERYAVKSDPRVIDVRPLPAGRPNDFSGAVGRAMTMERVLEPRSGRAGEPFTMDVLLRGEGNVALWPTPDISWPPHLRAYSEKVSDKIEINEGRLGGTKTFRYLVIPDSARTAGLPALVYSYFDPATSDYTEARSPATSYLVAPGKTASVSRVSPAPLQLRDRPAPARRLLAAMPGWVLALLAVLPPLVALLRFVPGRRRRVLAERQKQRDPTANVEDELSAALSQLVPRLDELEGERLETALRAVGVESEIAHQAVTLREHLRSFRYGPTHAGEKAAVLAEAQALLPKLKGPGKGQRIRRTISVATPAVLCLVLVSSLRAQSFTPEQLYERGAVAQAVQGFQQRAHLEPEVSAHWFNLGAAEFRIGAAGEALAAWTRAKRLAPRDPAIRRALRLVPPPDTRSTRALWSPPVTPDELWITAALLWIVGWIGYAVSRGRQRWAVVAVTALVVAGAAGGLALWYRRPLAIVTADHSIALSPHELAPSVQPVQVGSVVTLLSTSGEWDMVRSSSGEVGWLPRNIVEKL